MRSFRDISPLLATLCLLGLLAGCAPATGNVQVRADQLIAQAQAEEPQVTEILTALATELGGELYGLDNRLKTRDSLVRKIETKLHEDPAIEHPGEAWIKDALRYTLLVSDQPQGAHVAAIRTILTRLEARGYRVAQVKNYWPRGDNYSGTNCVLSAPSGLTWELQLHTPLSLKTKSLGRDSYEELRLVTTPVARKRALFDQMLLPWKKVPIPAGILEPGALHPTEKIIQIPRP